MISLRTLASPFFYIRSMSLVAGSMAAAMAAAAALSVASPSVALAQGQSEAAIPQARSFISPIRVIPVLGAASFTTASNVDLNNFGHSLAVGIYGDIGSGALVFETGVLSLNTKSEAYGDSSRSFSVQSWGVPLLAKLNVYGNAHQSLFIKGGAMPFSASGDTNEINVLGVAGVGGHIPLGLNSSIMLEGTYNRLFTNSGALANYQGIAFLGGLALNI